MELRIVGAVFPIYPSVDQVLVIETTGPKKLTLEGIITLASGNEAIAIVDGITRYGVQFPGEDQDLLTKKEIGQKLKHLNSKNPVHI